MCFMTSEKSNQYIPFHRERCWLNEWVQNLISKNKKFPKGLGNSFFTFLKIIIESNNWAVSHLAWVCSRHSSKGMGLQKIRAGTQTEERLITTTHCSFSIHKNKIPLWFLILNCFFSHVVKTILIDWILRRFCSVLCDSSSKANVRYAIYHIICDA